jgi:hypothetical protein
MSKKLLIAVFASILGATGCTSSSNDTTDGGGGNAGSAVSTAGAAGAGGADAGAAGADAGAAGADGGITDPVCGVEALSAPDFCRLFIADCGTATTGYATLAECMTTYAAVGVATPNKQQCESYHLCNAASSTGSDRAYHCGHAAGGGDFCTQTN